MTKSVPIFAGWLFGMTFSSPFFLSAAIGVLTTLACIYLLKPVAEHIGLVDTPGGRKTHASVVPLIGGIAIFVGFCFALLCLDISLSNYRGLLAGSSILVLIGVIDDFRELTPRIRLVGQCLASILLIEWGHLSLDRLGDLFFLGNINLGVASFACTLVFVLAFINAVNMIDGHDGLAGSIIMGQATLLAYVAYHFHAVHNVNVLLIFMAVLFVFLLFNLPVFFRKRASIFMGDAGSTFMGFLIAWFAVDLSRIMFLHHAAGLREGYSPVAMLWILGYPILDLLSVVLHRTFSLRSPFLASRDHLHYLLADLGFRTSRVTYVLFAFSFAMGVLGITMAEHAVREPWQLCGFIAVFLIYFSMTTYLQKKQSAV